MNGSTEHRASDAGEKEGGRPLVVNLGTARRMLPLVQRIVDDILSQQQVQSRLIPEQERLDRRRRNLGWPERQRRYQVHEELAAAQRNLEEALAEMEVLGVELFDSDEGRVGFPTVVNSRLAYFSWKATESAIQFWHFPGEFSRRAIPAAWKDSSEVQLKAGT